MTKKDELFEKYLEGDKKTVAKVNKQMKDRQFYLIYLFDGLRRYDNEEGKYNYSRLRFCEASKNDCRLLYNVVKMFFEALLEASKIKNAMLQVGIGEQLSKELKELKELKKSLTERKMW